MRGAVVYVHPFAEEMNKSRRMAALQSRALAAAGFAVLQIDLLGCGDSSGDFGDASWDEWIDDVLLAVRWLRGQHAMRRCGCGGCAPGACWPRLRPSGCRSQSTSSSGNPPPRARWCCSSFCG